MYARSIWSVEPRYIICWLSICFEISSSSLLHVALVDHVVCFCCAAPVDPVVRASSPEFTTIGIRAYRLFLNICCLLSLYKFPSSQFFPSTSPNLDMLFNTSLSSLVTSNDLAKLRKAFLNPVLISLAQVEECSEPFALSLMEKFMRRPTSAEKAYLGLSTLVFLEAIENLFQWIMVFFYFNLVLLRTKIVFFKGTSSPEWCYSSTWTLELVERDYLDARA